MSKELYILTDSDVYNNIISIAEWIQLHHQTFILNNKKICKEDLTIGVPGECLFPELSKENEESTKEEEKGILVYTNNEDKYMWLKSSWHHVEDVLNVSNTKSGWIMIENLGERLLMLTLTQLDYYANESEGEVPYGCCSSNDPAFLLWQNNKPVGMSSLKRKGSSIWGEEKKYVCDTLDTLYIRPAYRRQGHSISLLHMLTSQLLPGDHVALSYPISLNMCKVLLKFIQIYPSLRDTLWTLDEDGEVSGTVCLMLGTLIVRNVLQTPVPNLNSFHNDDQKVDLVLSNNRNISDDEVTM